MLNSRAKRDTDVPATQNSATTSRLNSVLYRRSEPPLRGGVTGLFFVYIIEVLDSTQFVPGFHHAPEGSARQRKEKALAEAAALIILRKKLRRSN